MGAWINQHRVWTAVIIVLVLYLIVSFFALGIGGGTSDIHTHVE